MSASVARAIREGIRRFDAGAHRDAERIFRRVSRNNPLESDAHHMLGITLHNQGQTEKGLAYVERAIKLDPKPWAYHQNHGLLLQTVGRNEEARDAFERATDRNKDSAECWHNWGTSLMACQQWEDARLALTHAIALRSNYALSHFNLGCIHLTLGEVREAARRFAMAMEYERSFDKAHANLIFCRDLLPETTPGMALAERRAYQTRHASMLNRWVLHNDPNPDRKLRIGYIGGDFRDHSAAYSFGPIIENHDPERFEVYVYADEPYVDPTTQRLRKHATQWRSIPEWDDQRVSALIQQDRVDVLVELSGYTHRHHLLACARKPAPVIVTAWGYLTGTGLDAVDAMFADDVLVLPEHEAYYTERVVRLPHVMAFSPPEFDAPIRARPAGSPPMFGYLGRIAKISDEALDMWAAILTALPESRLLLKDRGYNEERPKARIRREFEERGVSPERIEIRGTTNREHHLAVYNEIDVALDSWPHGGGMTTQEAAYMGCPTVTRAGLRTAERLSASTLARIGCGGSVTSDAEGYVREAVRLAGLAETTSHEAIRSALLQSVICDAPTQTAAVERAYRELWGDWCRTGSAR